MRIVQFIASSRWGGAEKVFVDLANILSERHEVWAVVVRQTQYLSRLSHTIHILELRSNPTVNNPFLVLELARRLDELKPDLVHTHAAKASILAKRAARLVSFPHLATKHNARKGRVFSTLPWVTTVSQESLRSVKSSIGGNVSVVPNGILPDSKSIPSARRHLCSEEGDLHISSGDRQMNEASPGKGSVQGKSFSDLFPGESFSLVAVGRLEKIKGFDLLIDACSNLPFPAHLTIVGEGPEREKLQSKIREHQLGGRIQLAGFRRDIPQIMARAHLVVLSSHSEGLPLVMLEALHYANVFIASPVGGVAEVLPELLLALPGGLGEKIEDVFWHYGKYLFSFHQLSLEKAHLFNLERVVAQYEALYEKIVSA